MNKGPVPYRITQALDVRGLYGPSVDVALGVEEPTVDLWESGELVPTKAQIKRLALLTGMPEEFFYREPEPSPEGQVFVCGSDWSSPEFWMS